MPNAQRAQDPVGPGSWNTTFALRDAHLLSRSSQSSLASIGIN